MIYISLQLTIHILSSSSEKKPFRNFKKYKTLVSVFALNIYLKIKNQFFILALYNTICLSTFLPHYLIFFFYLNCRFFYFYINFLTLGIQINICLFVCMSVCLCFGISLSLHVCLLIGLFVGLSLFYGEFVLVSSPFDDILSCIGSHRPHSRTS